MRTNIQIKAAMTAAALSVMAPAAAFAAEVQQTRTTTTQREEGGFDWGLLGLLGLAGLAGLGGKKKQEADIHIDARSKTGGPR